MHTLRHSLPRLALLLACACIATAVTPVAAQTAKPRIEKAADLPRFSYKIDGKVEELIRQADRFAPFGGALRRDIESVLAGYDIPDKATQRDLLNQLALLDFIDGRYDQALARAEQVRALQEKPADKLMSGLRLRAAATAAKAHALNSDAFRQAVADFVARELAAMTYEVVGNDVRELKASAELIGESLILGRAREVLQPIVDKAGSLSSEFSSGVLFSRYAYVVNLPLKATFTDSFTRYLAAHKVTKADIWAVRDVALPAVGPYKPVTLAVWDSGVDTKIFEHQLALDRKGRPLVIGFDKYARPANTELQRIPAALQGKLPQMKSRTKGLSDLQSNIDSAEATEVKQFLSRLSPDQYKDAMEELGLAGNYTHGTHVAGIAMAGNPHARLLVSRIEFGHTLKPDPCPSRELALRDAAAMKQSVAFMKQHGVRVANMSWGGDVKSIEGELEQCGTGATTEARKALARQLFEIQKNALTQAIAGAPKILFVAAAGNSGDDASFNESIPAAIDLPNLLTVGAVDLAGDEAGFTSYGPTVKVHANGYQVDSYLPGGDRVALSGTSMASPQVANLAAKLLAAHPSLTPTALVRVISETAERSADGRRVLVHPKKALAAAAAAVPAGNQKPKASKSAKPSRG